MRARGAGRGEGRGGGFLAHVLGGGTAEVEAAVRAAAAAEVMPRFGRLGDGDVTAKTGPHDPVTVADREAEARLTESLTALLPGSVVVGEESVHARPGLYGALDGDAPVWIVDPVDGTREFVRGDPAFCTLVALAHRGELLASWTFAPALDVCAVAVRGRGARVDGEPVRCGSPAPGAVLELATSHPGYARPDQRRALRRLETEGVRPRPCGSAGLEYLAVACGRLDGTVFSWEAAWDHAAGLLLVAEAGGAHGTLTGEPFRIGGGNALPLVTARDAATVARVRRLLHTPSAM